MEARIVEQTAGINAADDRRNGMPDNESSTQEYTKAIDYIYELMSDGTLEIGSRLPTERTIARTLCIGRNSIREALSILHGMGIIERKQGSGNYISGDAGKSISRIILMMLTLRRISNDDICEFRRIMEKTVCSTILKNGISAEHAEKLKDCIDELEAVQGEQADEEALGRLAAADDSFHNELINAADNGLVAVIMAAVTKVYSGFIEQAVYSADASVREGLMECHRDIYTGIINLDAPMVEAALDRHYDLVK